MRALWIFLSAALLGSANAAEDEAIKTKAQSIIVPTVSFHDATVQQAAAFLARRSQQLDPGVNIVVVNAPKAFLKMEMNNAPLSKALKYVSGLSNMQVQYRHGAAILLPPGTPAVEVPTSLIATRLAKLKIPTLNFSDATVREGLHFLAGRANSLGSGEPAPTINFTCLGAPNQAEKKVTLSLADASILDALCLLAETAGMDLTAEGQTISLKPRP